MNPIGLKEVSMENKESGSGAIAAENPRVPRGVRIRARAVAGVKFSFYVHLAVYITVNLLLVFINLMTTPLLWWCLWVIAGWGFALLIHAVVAFSFPDLFRLVQRMYQKELQRQWGK